MESQNIFFRHFACLLEHLLVAFDFLQNEQAVGSLVVSEAAAATATASDALRSTFFSAVSIVSAILCVSLCFAQFMCQISRIICTFCLCCLPGRVAPKTESQGGNLKLHQTSEIGLRSG